MPRTISGVFRSLKLVLAGRATRAGVVFEKGEDNLLVHSPTGGN